MFGGGKDKLLLRIYKLLLRRLPTKRQWKKMASGGGAGGLGSMLGSMLKNPMVLGGIAAGASVTAGIKAIKNADIFGTEQKKANKRRAKARQEFIEAMGRADFTAKKKFGTIATDFLKTNKFRAEKGMTRVSFLPIQHELEKMGYSMQEDIPQEAINQAEAAVKKGRQQTKARVNKVTKNAEVKDVINIPSAPVGQSVTAIPTEQKIVSHQTKTNSNAQQKKMMKFLIGEFTNNLIMNLQKTGSQGPSSVNKGKTPGLNVFK